MKLMKFSLPRVLTGLAAIALGFFLMRAVLLFLNYDRILIAFPYNVDYGEGPILDQVMRLAHFQTIYPKNITTLPFTIGNYPPLYQLIQLPFAWIFGPAFWYGRVINLISLLATAVFIGLVAYRLTQNWLAAATSGAMLLAVPYILHWSGFVRVDSFALCLSWAGLFVITWWPGLRKGVIITALCLTGAIFTRQSYGLAAPLAAFVWLLSQKPRWRAFELAAWTGGFSAILFLVLNLLTRGGFYFNVITANVNPFYWETVRNYWNGMWGNMPYLIVTSVIYVLLAVWRRQEAWWLAAPYLLASTASAITIGKDGSNVNYLFELSTALALLAGLVIALPGAAWQGRKWVEENWWLKALLIVFLVLQINGIYTWTLKDYYKWATDRALNERQDIAEMENLVQQAGGPVLADEFMGLIPLAGKPLVFQPFEYKQLVTASIWDEMPLLQDIADKKFAMILLYDPRDWDSQKARWTPAQLSAINFYYTREMLRAQTWVYVPR